MKTDHFLAKVTSIVLAGGAFLCIFVLMYFIYYYGWTAQRRFSAPLVIVLYVVFLAVLASLLFAFLRRNPEFKVNFAFVCVSLIASAYGGELVLRFTDFLLSGPRETVMHKVIASTEKKKEAAKLTKKFGVEIDTRDGLEVVTDLRKRGVDTVPSIAPSYFFVRQPDGSIKSAVNIHGNEIIPLGGVSNKMTVLCNENGYWVTYESDEHGFHNPRGTWRSSRVEIAALGDSFTHGYCVPSDKNFVGLIRQRYPAILNLGMASNGPLLELATLKEYLPLYRPKVVLWFYHEGSDLTDLQAEKKSGILMRYLKDDFNQGLPARQNDIDQELIEYIVKETSIAIEKKAKKQNRDDYIYEVVEFFKMTAIRNRLGLFLRNRLGLFYGRTSEEAELAELLSDVQGPNLNLFREILSQAKSRVSAWGGTLYFVYLPGFARYGNYRDIASEQRPQIMNLVKMLDIPLIDLHPVFRAQKDPLALFPFRQPVHYNEKGHQLVAEEVLKAISPSN